MLDLEYIQIRELRIGNPTERVKRLNNRGELFFGAFVRRSGLLSLPTYKHIDEEMCVRPVAMEWKKKTL